MGKQDSLASFFLRDFSQDIHQKAAMKNAYVLLSRHEYFKAAGFLLLANKQSEAIQVLIKNYHDPQLALFISVILEGDSSSTYQFILNTHMNQVAQYTQDVYLQAIIAWCNQDYVSALHSLLSFFDPNQFTGECTSVDKYFLDNHSNCACLQFPLGRISHQSPGSSSPQSTVTPTEQVSIEDFPTTLSPFMHDEVFPLAIALLHSPFYRFDMKLYREPLCRIAHSILYLFQQQGYLSVLLCVVSDQVKQSLQGIGVDKTMFRSFMQDVLNGACVNWLDEGVIADFRLLHKIIQPKYLLNHLNQQIASGYVSDLISYCLIADSLTQQEPDALHSLLHTLYFTLSHANSLTLRTLEAEPLCCGRKSRFCSSLVTSWFRLLLDYQQEALPSSIAEAYDFGSITHQALLGAVFVGWELGDEHLLVLALQELRGHQSTHVYQEIIDAITTARISLECQQPSHSGHLQEKRISLPEWCLLYCRLLMYHNTLTTLVSLHPEPHQDCFTTPTLITAEQEEEDAQSERMSRWLLSLRRLLLESPPQVQGFDAVAVRDFLQPFTDPKRIVFTGESAQTLWTLTKCSASLEWILKLHQEEHTITLSWNASQIEYRAVGISTVFKKKKNHLIYIAPTETISFPWYSVDSLFAHPSDSILPDRADVMVPLLNRPAIAFGVSSSHSVQTGLYSIDSNSCSVFPAIPCSSRVVSLACNPLGDRLVALTRNNQILLFDCETEQLLQEYHVLK